MKFRVLVKKTAKASETSGAMSKLAMSLGVVVCLCVGLIFFTKWYQRKYKLTEMSTEMKIVAQHHLGPKKQLAVVRVSGRVYFTWHHRPKYQYD